MEDLNSTEGAAPVAGEQTEGQTAADTSVEQTAPQGDTTSDETTQPAAEAKVEEGDQEVEIVEDADGKKHVPYEAFKARMDKMAAQKHEAVEKFLESATSNPEVKQQLLQALGMQGKEDVPASETTKEAEGPSLFDSFLQKGVQPELHEHYRGLAESMYGTMMPHIEQKIQQAIAPLLSVVGQQHVDKFSASHPDFTQHKPEIMKIMNSGRAKNISDAYILATHEKKIKGAGASALAQEKARKESLAKNPMRRTQGAPTTQRKPGSLREAFEQAGQETGYIK